MDVKELQNWMIEEIALIKQVKPEEIDPTDDFNNLGLDSLRLYELLGELEDLLNKKIPETIFLDFNTIDQLAEYLINADSIEKTKDIVKEVKNMDNFSLADLSKQTEQYTFYSRINAFKEIPDKLKDSRHYVMREILSPLDREVLVIDPFDKTPKKMLMFGSNNYLGLANHDYVKNKVKEAVNTFGAGIAGSPLLNGYTCLHRELEERLAYLKHAEAAVVFPNGFGTNVGLVNGLTTTRDVILFDEYSHASFIDGLKLHGGHSFAFLHNNMNALEELLKKSYGQYANIFVAVEGVYSMEGDIAPLEHIVPLCLKYNALLMIDDAHGTGIIGENGAGTAEHCHVENYVDINMGTFSKALANVGGFVAAKAEVIEYLRFYARSYIFSASLPPQVVSAVLAGLDIIQDEPWRRQNLKNNTEYAVSKIRQLNIPIKSESAIIAILTPSQMDMAKARFIFQRNGIFINTVEYPAVPADKQRFRISMMATHTQEDIDKLVASIEEVWTHC